MECVVPLVQDVCCFAVGVALQRFQLLNASDGEVIRCPLADLCCSISGVVFQAAVKVAVWVTGPSLVLQALCRQGRLTPSHFVACGCGFLVTLVTQAVSWLLFRKNYERQRAVLMGCAVGSSVVLWSFPLAESIFGTVGLQAAILFGVSNIFAEHVLSYLNFASAGPASPESYVHQDGSVYRGQWDGLNKEGVGTYKYKSGAMYEGEWRENQKSGRGVYYFKTGGLYEGEWLDGNRNGVGVRTFSDGRMQAGRWLGNKLVSSLEVWQCTDAVMGATQAAKAAREVQVGGGRLADALHSLLQQPLLWATGAAVVIQILNRDLSPTAWRLFFGSRKGMVAASLHCPLALTSAGLLLPYTLRRAHQVFPSVLVVGCRLLVSLLLSSAAALVCYYFFPEFSPFVLPLLLVSLAPVSLQAISTVRQFRLNEELVGTIVSLSSLASSVLMVAIAAATVVTRFSVRHSRLPLYLASIGFSAAAAVAGVSLVAALKFRPSSKMQLRLRKLEADSVSTLDAAGLQELMRNADTESGPSSRLSSEEKGSPPQPPQALHGCRRRRHKCRRMTSPLRRRMRALRPVPSLVGHGIACRRMALSRTYIGVL